MSVPRAAWFAELLARVLPDAQLVDEQRLPISDLLARDDEAEDGEENDDHPFLDLASLSPEARAQVENQLETFLSQHEDAWIDSPLPALGGASPRQALEDPTRRDAVLRLL
jgi:hypothetical protein